MKTYNDLNDYEIMYLVSENDDDAKELIVSKYKPIILKIASKYLSLAKNYGLEHDDLIQEGYVGLYYAMNNYNDGKNALFYTYATKVIESKICNLLKLSQTKKNFSLNSSLSLDMEYDSESGSSLLDFIEDSNAILPDRELEYKELIVKIKSIIYELDIEQGSILELKLNGFSNGDIASLLNLNKRTVSNIMTNIKKTWLLKK